MTPLDWHLNDVYPSPEQYLNRIPSYIDALSPDPIYRQIDEKSLTRWYPQLPSAGWIMTEDNYLIYPGLPPVAPAAYAIHLGERIFIYPAGWICILQLSGDYSLSRLA